MALARNLLRHLPEPVKGRIDRLVYRGPQRPLNGQSGREAIMEAVIRAVQPTLILETGTYLGWTTCYLAGFGVPVHSVEASPRFHAFARGTVRGTGAQLHLGDSRSFLRDMAAANPDARVVAYLDAHWHEDLPLAGELEALRSWAGWVAVIDDFQVPDDEAYTYDDYGPGKRLDVDYLAAAGVPLDHVYFPTLRGADEDPPHRGCAVVASSELQTPVASLHLLRPAQPV